VNNPGFDMAVEAVELIHLTYFVEGTDLGFGLTVTPEHPEHHRPVGEDGVELAR
jgi:hypothetical protein